MLSKYKKPPISFIQKSNKFRTVFLKDTLFMSIYPKDIKTLIQNDIYTPIVTATLFITAKI